MLVVFLIMGSNLIAPTKAGSVLPVSRPVAWVLGVGLGYGAYSVHNSDLVRFLPSIGLEMLFVGAAVALIYLTAQAWLVLRAMRRRVRASAAA